MLTPKVAVIGGGASGVLAAIHLLREGVSPVAIVDPAEQLGRGIAYGTEEPDHRLNVRAGNMSALADEPDHFVRWCRSEGDVQAHSFAPRTTYARYLHAALREASKAGDLEHVRDRALGLEPGTAGDASVRLASGGLFAAERVILALGHGPSAAPPGLPTEDLGPRWIEDPWRRDALDGLPRGGRVLLIGTGLTAVDVALSCARRGDVAIDALSRHGLLPRRHRSHRPTKRPPVPPVTGTTAEALVASFRAAIQEAEARSKGWREVVDGLRPVTNELWAGLDEAEQRRLLEGYGRLWEVHRHRMAPEIAERIDGMRAEERFTIRRGAVRDAASTGRGLEVRLAEEDGERVERYDAMVNCTGPRPLVASGDPLVGSILDSGLGRPDPLGMGFAVDRAGTLVGREGAPPNGISVLGPLRRGRRFYETVAIPEIRAQAAELARGAGVGATGG